MEGKYPEAGGQSPTYGKVPLPPKAVSPRWRVGAVILIVVLAVVAILPFVLTYQASNTETAVQWHQYSFPGGPGSLNYSQVAPGTFCPWHTAVGPILFTLTWLAAHGVSLVHVRVWTVVNPPNITLLYVSSGGSSGSGSFNPLPTCGQSWFVDDYAMAATTVTVTMVLVYNYTATTTEHWIP
jgi:hypothetical protein